MKKSQKLKIAICIDFFYDTIAGAEAISLELARELRNRGHEIEIICSRTPFSRKAPPDSTFPIRQTAGMYHMREYSRIMPMKWLADLCYQTPGWLFRRGVVKILRKHRYDLVYTYSYDLLAAFAKHRDIDVPVEFHVVNPVWPPKVHLLERANHISCLGELLVDELKEKYSINSSYIPPAINLRNFHPLPKDEIKRVREELGVNLDERLLLFANRLVPFKNCENLIRALPLILEQQPNTKLIIFGQGVLENKLKELASNLNLDRVVTFMGTVSVGGLNKYYNAADVVVVPSFYESCSMVSVEALSAGRPLLVSKGMEELRKQFPGVRSADPKSPEDIASHALALLQKGNPKIDMKNLAHFDVGYCAREYEKIFYKLVSNKAQDATH